MTIKVTYNVTDVYVTQDVSPVYINVSYSGGGGGGAAVWGGITGTLSDQTDLQTALDGKFNDPTGTTSQYLRGDGSLATFPAIPSGTVQSVGLTMPSAFSVANSPVTTSGTLAVTGAGTTAQYIRGDGSLDTFPSLTGYVPYTGATANVDLGTHRILAQNATIASSGSGDTVTLNHSSGSGVGLNITKGGNGEGLYINKTSGSGNAATIIGTINATTLVKSGGTSSQFLKADGTVDSSVYVPTSREITINGVTYDLSANCTYSVGTVTSVAALTIGTSGTDISSSVANGTTTPVITLNIPTASALNRGVLSSTDWSTFNAKQGALTLTTTGTSGAATLIGTTLNIPQYSGGGGGMAIGGSITSATAGSVLFAGASGVLAQDNANLFWDDSNNRLGIGTNAPTNAFTIFTNNASAAPIQLRNTNASGFSTFYISTQSGGDAAGFGYVNSGNATANLADRFVFYTFNNKSISFTRDSAFAPNLFIQGTNGNVLINSQTDSGERLQVTGNVKVSGNIAQSNIGDTLTSGSRISFISSQPIITGTTSLVLVTGSDGATQIIKSARIANTSGAFGVAVIGSDPGNFLAFNPTSGTATYTVLRIAAEINQTGTANGITRGLYVNPTLTAAADFRAIEWSNNSGWGLYGAGTAKNYIAGNLLLNSTTDSGERLQVTGTMKVTGDVSIVANSSGTTLSSYNGTSSIVFLGNTGSGTVAYELQSLSTRRFRILANATSTTFESSNQTGSFIFNNRVSLPASTTTKSTLNIASGTAPTSPNDGDIWFDGTDIKMRIGGVTKTFTLL
jgi:hypothetical protein